MAESFRILSTNVNYLLEEKDKGMGQVVMVTSSIKGEGKTMLAHNLALAYASLNKKVLLIGADLRNPQLHNFYNLNVNHKGLSDYLNDPGMNWKDCVVASGADNPSLKFALGVPYLPIRPSSCPVPPLKSSSPQPKRSSIIL